MNRRPLNLLEVMIGLVLTAILLTALFSNFRHLMLTDAELKKIRTEKHWEYVVQARLNRIFESIHPGAHFTSGPYQEFSENALLFTFDNGVDPDPNFCGTLEGILLLKKQQFCLLIDPNVGTLRTEIFLDNVDHLLIEYLDPKKGKWLKEWDQTGLPPMVKITVAKKQFTFTLPHANQLAAYSSEIAS